VAAGNAMAPALVLLEAIAADAAQAVVAAGDGRGLRIGLGHG